MINNTTCIDFYGLPLDIYRDAKGCSWVTLTSLAKGLGVHRQTIKDWVLRSGMSNAPTLEVRVGDRRHIKATAYPIEVAVAFLHFLVSKGKPLAIELVTKSLTNDLEALFVNSQ